MSVPTATDLDSSALEDSAFDAVDDPGALPEPVATAGPDDRPVVDAGDLDLALRYLPDHQVVVVTEPLAADAFAVVLADCAYVGATLVVVLEAGAAAPDLPSSATAFEAPGSDPDGLFARTVGGFAAGLDQGTGAAQALDRATTSAGWQPASS